jgi:hypothetical protein
VVNSFRQRSNQRVRLRKTRSDPHFLQKSRGSGPSESSGGTEDKSEGEGMPGAPGTWFRESAVGSPCGLVGGEAVTM